MVTKIRSKITGMAPAQAAYAVARAAHEVVQAEYTRRLPSVDSMELDAYIEASEAIADELHYYEFLSAKWQAEKDLLAWAHNLIQTSPEYAIHRADIERLFACNLLSIRDKLIDLSMRLKV